MLTRRDAAFEQVEQAAAKGARSTRRWSAPRRPWDEERFGVYVRPVMDFIARKVCASRRGRSVFNLAGTVRGYDGSACSRGRAASRILDYKTEKNCRARMAAYDEHRLQLAAYARRSTGKSVWRGGCVQRVREFDRAGRVEIIRHGDLTQVGRRSDVPPLALLEGV